MSTAEVEATPGPDGDRAADEDQGAGRASGPEHPGPGSQDPAPAPAQASHADPTNRDGAHPAGPTDSDGARPAGPTDSEGARPAGPTDSEGAQSADPTDSDGDRPADPMEPDGVRPADDVPSGRPRRVLVLACVLILLLGGGGLLFAARQLTEAPAANNRALTDAGATTQVIGDVSDTLGKVFSYVPQDTGVTEDAARDLLGGRAARQYAALFGELRQRVAEQKLSLTTHVVRAAVVRLTRDQAELLVFLDQRAQRDGKPATAAAAQLHITAQHIDGHWQITDMQAR
ncbi:hypothetical protein ACFYM2_05730 [Streptomyces sp. NPDC006711]|uniref:hypothetical protein n=1 Tax=Streptomyces sp. NPDC006711 TaxID=3364762 RepID=UPI0036D0FF8D